MNNLDISKKNQQNLTKMTLKDYYLSIPDATYPKTAFINEVASLCKVSVQTVRNWVIYGMRPQNKKHEEILSKLTGIPAENLWTETA